VQPVHRPVAGQHRRVVQQHRAGIPAQLRTQFGCGQRPRLVDVRLWLVGGIAAALVLVLGIAAVVLVVWRMSD
jgi:hypothetical protein